jgi:hypothetical protein
LIKNQSGKKVAAVAMLIVLAFSITPAIVFHNWLADHTDTLKKITDSYGERVAKKPMNCHCDNFVAESPFTEPVVLFTAPAVKITSSLKSDHKCRLIITPDYYYLLRGPPVV